MIEFVVRVAYKTLSERHVLLDSNLLVVNDLLNHLVVFCHDGMGVVMVNDVCNEIELE